MPTLIENRKASFNYEFLEKIEAGIELRGFEVKALRERKGSLKGAYAIVRGDEMFLVNFDIPPYQPANTPKDYNSQRPRKLLLTKKEISHLAKFEKQKGLTIVPISVYTKGAKVKVGLVVSKSKKKIDKREIIKKRDTEREIQRELKDR